ncbi:FxLYD domain-containing protein [Halorubrum halodurans]|nr:FxLYD domain-containing protein [Halorubrum halodurans]
MSVSVGEESSEASGDEEGASDDIPQLDVDSEFLEDQSDSDGELADHAFEYVGESTQPWAVVGTASHTRGERADLQVSVNFIDEDNTIIRDSYDLITDVASDQSAEFIVEYAGDDPERVSEYEIVVDVR